MDYEKTFQTRHIQWGWDITKCQISVPLPWSPKTQIHLFRRCPTIYGFMLYNMVMLEDLFDISQPGYSSADLTYKLHQSGKLTQGTDAWCGT